MTVNANNSIADNITKSFDELAAMMKPDEIDEWYGEAEKVFNIFFKKDRVKDFVDILEINRRYINMNNVDGEEKEKKLKKVWKLLALIKKNEADFLLDSIKRKGFSLSNDSEFAKSLKGRFFRILQDTRLGKKTEVLYTLTQIFASKKEKMPQEFIEAAKEEWNIDQFKAFIYAFLTNFTAVKVKNN